MNSSRLDDSDYPYAVRTPTPANPASCRPSWKFAWRWIRAWLRRSAFAAALATPIAVIAVSIVAFRARSQAMIVAGLRDHGFHVTYWHQFDDYNDRTPGFLRDWCGDDFWNDVGFVGGHAESESDSAFFCNACSKLTCLRGFGITSDFLTFDQIGSWACLSRLEDLAVWSPHISDADLGRIARLSTLRTLSLRSPRITDFGIRQLTSLPRLVSLELFSAQLNGSGPRNTSGFPHLAKLEIRDSSGVIDDAIVNLGPLPELEEVMMMGARIGDRAIQHLARGAKLSSIELDPTEITDEGLASLEKCMELGSVKLVGASITDKGLAALSGKQLWQLTLDKSPITDGGLRFIADIEGLMFLSLNDTCVTGTVANYLPAHYPPLNSLDLDGAALTHEGIAAIAAANLPSFLESKTHLSVARTSFGDSDLMLFVECEKFGFLSVIETNVTAKGVRAFCEARKVHLTATGLEDTLKLASDFPEVTEPPESPVANEKTQQPVVPMP